MSIQRMPLDVRRRARDDVEYHTRLTGIAFALVHAQITDMSPLGCMVRCSNEVAMGERITLDLPIVGDVRGVAVWSLGTRIGVAFDREIPADLYPRVVAAMSRRSIM